jgi:hypothetical protein
MKLYIENYNIQNIFKKQKSLDQFLSNKSNIFEVYSTDGIYVVDQNNIYKLSILDKNIIKIDNFIEKYNILIDKSEITTKNVNQIPFDNFILKSENYIYKLNNKSRIKLVLNLILNETMEYIPADFYFDIPDELDVNSPLFKQDIQEFLFHLQ